MRAHPPVHDPMYTRSILVSAHSRASLRLSGEWGAATTGSSFDTSHLHQARGASRASLLTCLPMPGEQGGGARGLAPAHWYLWST